MRFRGTGAFESRAGRRAVVRRRQLCVIRTPDASSAIAVPLQLGPLSCRGGGPACEASVNPFLPERDAGERREERGHCRGGEGRRKEKLARKRKSGDDRKLRNFAGASRVPVSQGTFSTCATSQELDATRGSPPKLRKLRTSPGALPPPRRAPPRRVRGECRGARKPGPVDGFPRRRPFLWGGGLPPPRAAYPEVMAARAAPQGPKPLPSLCGLSPSGACRASRVTTAAVGSYPTVSPLPRPLRAEAVCSLLRCPWPFGRWALPTTLPCGARTFLGVAPVARLAAARAPLRLGSYTMPAHGRREVG